MLPLAHIQEGLRIAGNGTNRLSEDFRQPVAILITGYAHCQKDLQTIGILTLEAMQISPGSSYVVDHAKRVEGLVTNAFNNGIHPADVVVGWEWSDELGKHEQTFKTAAATWLTQNPETVKNGWRQM